MQRLRELRKEKGLTMKKLGEMVGVGESTISQYENGKRQPDFTTLDKLAEIFNVSVDYLLGRTDVPQQASQEKSTANGELEENLVVYCRNGKTKELKLSAEKMKLFEKMLDAIKDEDVDL